MSGVVVIEGNAGSLTGAAHPRRRPGDQGPRRARASGIDQKGGTIITLGSVGSMTGFMMQRGRQIICGDAGPGLGDSMYDGTIYVGGKVKALGIDCVPGEWTDADTEFIERKFRIYGLGTPPSSRSSCAARSSTTTTTSSRPSGSSCSREGARWRRTTTSHTPPNVLGPQPDLHAGGHQRHPHEVRARPLPHARVLDVQADPALGRADVHARHADPVRDRGLPREVRDEDGARRALRQEADRARHPRLHHRHELRRAVAGGQDGARQGRLDGRLGDVLGRGRDDPARARPVDQVVLPVHPEPVRVQPAPPDAGRRRASSSSARAARSAWAAT